MLTLKLVLAIVGIGLRLAHGVLKGVRAVNESPTDGPPRAPDLDPDLPAGERLVAIWRLLAERQGGTCTEVPASCPGAYDPWPAIEVTIDGVTVRARVEVPASGRLAGVVSTRIDADMVSAETPTIDVHAEGLSARGSKELGKVDTEIGVAEFDRIFFVDATPPQSARAMISDVVARWMVRRFEDSQLTISIGRVTLVVPRVVDTEKELVVALDLVARVAAAEPGESLSPQPYR